MKTWTFIIVAAGSGKRAGQEPKQFRLLGGKPLWIWSAKIAEKLYRDARISECIIVVPEDRIEDCRKVAEVCLDLPVEFVPGGTTRSESVLNALERSESEYVMIHDGARPFLSVDLTLEMMTHCSERTGVIPCLPVVDALKAEDEEGNISVLDNRGVYLTQTPQSFHTKNLLKVLLESEGNYKDEGQVWLEKGLVIKKIWGDPLNFKITYPGDWDLAEGLATKRTVTRSGTGYDIHTLLPGRKLVLGGVEIPGFSMGLMGHSDADIIIHVICDSILGAAGFADIGVLFPASDQDLKGIESSEILREVLSLIGESNWEVDSVDVVLQAQKPHLQPYSESITNNLKNLFKKFSDRTPALSLKFKSGEAVGPVGRCECMQAWSVATVFKKVQLANLDE